MINSHYIVYGIIILLGIFIIFSIIKKAIKLAIVIIIILLGFSAYNIFAKGISPTEEIQGYSTNIEYGKSIADYSESIRKSVDNIRKVVESKKLDNNSISIIKTENANLHKYEIQVSKLKHTKKLNSFHEKYCGYLKTITNSTDGTEKLANLGDVKNIDGVMKNLNSGFDDLWKLNKNR